MAQAYAQLCANVGYYVLRCWICVFYCEFFAQFVLPYIKYLLSAAYQYDREHKISEKVLSQGIETVDTLGKAGLSWTGAIYGMGDGKVGQVITKTAAWFVEGVTGGIHEGVGEGMVIMGAPRRSSGPERR